MNVATNNRAVNLISRLKWLFLSALTLVFLVGARPALGQDNWEVYRRAIIDASVYNRNRVLPLRLLNPQAGQVRVVTFTNYNYPDPGQKYRVPAGRYIWVTGDGEVAGACAAFHLQGAALTLRLNQLLGLKPDTQYTTFVVMSVPVDRVLRPAPDPNPATPFPCADPANNQCGNAFPDGVPPEYFSFFSKQSISAYQVGQTPAENGYPWTHLGYTYDWAPYAATKYGASEYVIKPDTEATIISKTATNDYCNPH